MEIGNLIVGDKNISIIEEGGQVYLSFGSDEKHICSKETYEKENIYGALSYIASFSNEVSFDF
ncbi:hypothetical protein [Acetobacter sp. DsW_059]|uniref:hypothetical protein n=1 Tax=Acetobacter sp. DsW_059 TaxID=1670661 RepID=UPI000A37A4D4|nr:hypothetical protein [Acetobacter sp. DsW_059]OUJ10673.1 hypothetical protein HK25_05400 [Acetobacter sp. DsW_059]